METQNITIEKNLEEIYTTPRNKPTTGALYVHNQKLKYREYKNNLIKNYNINSNNISKRILF